jgi:hypothetical protein
VERVLLSGWRGVHHLLAGQAFVVRLTLVGVVGLMSDRNTFVGIWSSELGVFGVVYVRHIYRGDCLCFAKFESSIYS